MIVVIVIVVVIAIANDLPFYPRQTCVPNHCCRIAGHSRRFRAIVKGDVFDGGCFSRSPDPVGEGRVQVFPTVIDQHFVHSIWQKVRWIVVVQ